MNIVGIYGAFNWNANDGDLNNKIVLDDLNPSSEENSSTSWSHDSGCTLFIDGKHICSINEERLTRVKYDGNFPKKSIEAALNAGGISSSEVDIVYVVATNHFVCIVELNNGKAESLIRKYFPTAKIKYIGHHICHAASSVFTSPFNEGSFLTFDGGGSAIIDPIRQCIDYIENSSIGYFNKEKGIFRFYNLLEDNYNCFGQLYSCGASKLYQLKTGSPLSGWGDIQGSVGKIMGLSAYGSEADHPKGYVITDSSMPYINFDMFIKESKSKYFFENWDTSETPFSSAEEGAYYLQKLFENGMIDFLKVLKNNHLDDTICFAGGTFLNIITNTLIKQSGLFKNIHIPPYTDDSGVHFGAAIWGCVENGEDISLPDNIALLGLEYSNEEVLKYIEMFDLKYRAYDVDVVADLIINNKIVGWFQGRSEHGPRALGSRSIFMNPTRAENKDIMNKRVKHREYWRPFAGIVLEDKVSEYFNEGFITPHMLYTQTAKTDKLPAITHVDNTCRIQTVNRTQNAKVYDLLTRLDPSVILNTSFNDNGQPIVETPYHAIKSFVTMDIDSMVIGDFIIDK